jgi:hypothetical protein
MNRIISAIALACVGAGAALGWQSYRQFRSSRKANAQDIDRWEEEGGHLLPARQAAASAASAHKPG